MKKLQMKKFFFGVIFFLPIFLFAQKDGEIGIITTNGNNNWGKGYQVIYFVESETNEFYGQNNSLSLKYGDIITHVDGTHIYQMDIEEFNNLCRGKIGSEVEFTILRMGSSNPIKIKVKRTLLPIAYPGSDPFRFLTFIMGAEEKVSNGIRLTNQAHSMHQISTDKEIDFGNYTTFDFEYTNQKQPLLEKDLAFVMEGILESKGLKRDKENPDILVFLSFFSDIKEQYVPPTQQINTRYQIRYNVWTRSLENRPYIESTTQGDYTKTEYLTRLDIVFMDARKAKNANNKVPPIIWNATFENTTNSKTTILNEAEREYPLLLNSYPLVSFQYDLTYCDWGLCSRIVMPDPYKTTDPLSWRNLYYASFDVITGVKPNSFAERLGLREGDIIQWAKLGIWGKYTEHPIIKELYNGYYCQVNSIKITRDGKGKTFLLKESPPIKRMIMSVPIL